MDTNYNETISVVQQLLNRYGGSLKTLGMTEPHCIDENYDCNGIKRYFESPKVKLEINFNNSNGVNDFFELLDDFEKQHRIKHSIMNGNKPLQDAYEQLEILLKLQGS